MNRQDAGDGTLGWHEIDSSVTVPLDRIAIEKPALLRVLTKRVVHEPAGRNRAITTHFGSSS